MPKIYIRFALIPTKMLKSKPFSEIFASTHRISPVPSENCNIHLNTFQGIEKGLCFDSAGTFEIMQHFHFIYPVHCLLFSLSVRVHYNITKQILCQLFDFPMLFGLFLHYSLFAAFKIPQIPPFTPILISSVKYLGLLFLNFF